MERRELRESGDEGAGESAPSRELGGRRLGLRDRLLWESAIKIMFIACHKTKGYMCLYNRLATRNPR
jgi:hypothetical protein